MFVIAALCVGLPAIIDAQHDGALPSVAFRAAFALTTIGSMFVFVGHLVLRWRRREVARVLVDGK